MAFKRAVAARGLPGTAYVDNGACFVDETIAVTCAKLGIRITHSPPYRPEGRGKIERFFETVRGQFLVEISPDGRPAPGRRVPAGLEQPDRRGLSGRFQPGDQVTEPLGAGDPGGRA